MTAANIKTTNNCRIVALVAIFVLSFAFPSHLRAAEHRQPASSLPHAPSITLSPAVIALQAAPGQSTTQGLTVSNQTPGPVAFDLEAYDVIVRDGKRIYVKAGETPGGIAQAVVFSPRTLLLQPGESATVRTTVTVPEKPSVRAVAALFQGKSVIAVNGGVGMTGSLGALITFTLSHQFKLESLPTGSLKASSDNFTITQPLINTGTEPVIPKGTLALVDASGALVGKVQIAPQRLLPGEQLDFKAEYSRPLKPGKYHALISLKNEAGLLTTSSDFVVP